MSHWVADGLQLFSWWRSTQRDVPPTLLFSNQPMHYYWPVLLANVVVVTLTWTVLYDWDTDGIDTLAALLVGEMVAVDLVAAGLLVALQRCKTAG